MRTQKNRYLGTLTGFGLVALAVISATLICLASPVQCRSLEESIERVFETGPTPEVHIRSFNGDIEVRGGSANGVRAVLTKHVYRMTGLGAERALDAIEVQMVQDGDRIVIEALGPQMRMFLKCTGAYLRVEVPAGARVFAETTNGPIRTEGLDSFQSLKTSDAKIEVRTGRGEIHAESSNGSIRAEIEDATLRAATSNAGLEIKARNSEIDLTTSNGVIEVEIDGGSVRARSSSGRIEIEGRAARADAETTNGAIEMEFGDAPVHAHARTTNGAIEFEGRPSAISVLRTTNGRIEVEVPRDAQLWVEASTTNGSIRHDLVLSEVKLEEKQRLIGRVGPESAARLMLETTNSSIDIDVN
jgi:DUF4097 and DUF4098 domain-containing protein YvlB